jgi:hypothetical protein
MVGHTGHDVSLTNILNIPILLLNPWSYGFIYVSVRATPTEHEDHHSYPRSAPRPSAVLSQFAFSKMQAALWRTRRWLTEHTSQQQQLLGHKSAVSWFGVAQDA